MIVLALGLTYGGFHALLGVDGRGVGVVLGTAVLKSSPVWFLYSATTAPRIATGLLLSSLGDFLLELDGYLGAASPETATHVPTDLFFVAGLGSFLVAHCFYIADFGERPGAWSGGVAGAVAVIGGVGLVGFLWDGVPEPLRGAVVVYAGVIAAMAYTAIGAANAANAYNAAARQKALVGAVSFVISDSLLAIDRFKSTPEWKAIFTAGVMTTYYFAQLKIAQSGMTLLKSKQG